MKKYCVTFSFDMFNFWHCRWMRGTWVFVNSFDSNCYFVMILL